MNKRNLRKLANYLLNLPEGYEHFDMALYSNRESVRPEDAAKEVIHECGTVACAAGHGPAAGIAALKDENWSGYTRRVFGTDENARGEWDWCFSAHWNLTDNTPQGAALRIMYLLDYGLPGDWDYGKKTVELYTNAYDVVAA